VTRYVRFCRFDDEAPCWGIRRDAVVEPLTDAPWRGGRVQGPALPFGDLRLLAPAEPTKILALAYNYRSLFGDPAAMARAGEVHFSAAGFEPLVFLKGPNCLAHPGASIAIPGGEVWVEVEVTAVISRRVRNLSTIDEARSAVAGLTIGNDITALNVLGRDWHLARSKSLDGFCPLGPELVDDLDDRELRVTTSIDGRMTQDGITSDRVLDTYQAVLLASRIMTLEPGDAVLTGTPAGARQSLVRAGNRISLSIEGIGTLENQIVASEHP
jgi:2-keto-4-pentenoate hydratase/2-oxohepta-3-ene-1,7-dioic acid hydratase in catechol pathway